ncbi:hypothetical protein HK104_008964 [Borealophlyctis nickersoniae]|nr:hypothetical protein HK104_008964 [Borealophlyctis nickersoniae]
MSKPKDGFESVTITTEPENLKQSLDNPTKSPTASDTTPATTTTTKPERLPKNFGSEYVCPDASSNIFSRLTYSWIDPLFWVGAKRPLDFKDIWQLSDYWKVENLLATFESAWQDELAIAKANREEDEASVIHLGGSDVALASTPEKGKRRKEPSLMRAMWRSWGWRLGPIGIVKMFSDLASILSPFIVKHLLSYVQESRIIHEMNKGDGPDTALPSLAEGFGYALGLFFLQIIGTLLLSNFFQRATAQGMAMRGALAAAIYRKSLKLSAAARQDFSSGKVMTIVATDTQRVEQFVTFLHMIWTAPVQIAVITVFLLLQIGPASLAGIGLLLILAPVQMFLLRKLSAIRRTVAPLTDSRVKLTQEVLQGIRVIKFFAWENPFLEKIEDIREKEVNQVFRRSFYNAFVMAIAFGIPVFSAVVSIAIYGGTRSLDPTAVFPALTWFSQLRFPLMFLPNIIVGWADFKIALQRIGGMLLAAELDEQAPIIPDAPYAVQILDGEFIWETPPPDQEKNGNSEKKKDTNKKGQDTLPTTTANLKSSSSPTPAPTVPHPPTKPTLRNLNLTIATIESTVTGTETAVETILTPIIEPTSTSAEPTALANPPAIPAKKKKRQLDAIVSGLNLSTTVTSTATAAAATETTTAEDVVPLPSVVARKVKRGKKKVAV